MTSTPSLARRYAACVQMVDMACDESWSIGAALRTVAHLIFPDSSEHIVEKAIQETWNSTGSRLGNVILEQAAAVQSVEQGLVDLTRSKCLFVQVFEKLQPLPPVLLRSKLDDKERLFRVYFRGVDGEYERGVDWGGLYRDTMTRVTVRQPASLPLLPHFCSGAGFVTCVTLRLRTVCARPCHRRTCSRTTSTCSSGALTTLSTGPTPTPLCQTPPTHQRARWTCLSLWASSWVSRCATRYGCPARRLLWLSHSCSCHPYHALCQADFPFELSPMVWKLLVKQPVMMEDLLGVDADAAYVLHRVSQLRPGEETSVRTRATLCSRRCCVHAADTTPLCSRR